MKITIPEPKTLQGKAPKAAPLLPKSPKIAHQVDRGFQKMSHKRFKLSFARKHLRKK